MILSKPLFERDFYYRTESVCSKGWFWDISTANEVLNEDVYHLRQFKERCPEAKNFLDIGANIGSFTLFVKHLFPDAFVRCAEPLNENFALLSRNVAGLSNIKLFNYAIVGTDETQVGFEAPGLVTGRDGDLNSGNGYVARDRGPQVMACRIGELMKDYDVVDYCKFDCEGAELEILQSIAGTDEIKKLKFIAGEWHSNIAQLLPVLSPTHVVSMTGSNNLGFFEARLK